MYWFFKSPGPETSASRRRYGWRRDLHDERDLMMYPAPPAAPVGKGVDLRAKCPPVYDQGQLGSCTAMAICAAFQFDEMSQGEHSAPIPSRLFLYFNERAAEGTTSEDSGASIRDGFKSLAREGVCPEPMWPYCVDRFAEKPGPECYQAALAHRAVSYRRLRQELGELLRCLDDGYPFVFGILVYPSFETAPGGRVPMPDRKKEQLLGGHAVMIVGYSPQEKVLIGRNSWGAAWGDHGYFYLPYEYALDRTLTSDIWCVSKVSDAPAAEPLHD